MLEIFRQMAFIFEFIFAYYFFNINKLFVGDFLEVVLFLSQFHPKKNYHNSAFYSTQYSSVLLSTDTLTWRMAKTSQETCFHDNTLAQQMFCSVYKWVQFVKKLFLSIFHTQTTHSYVQYFYVPYLVTMGIPRYHLNIQNRVLVQCH